ncbi:hypothetical protein VTN02DRAFT_2173 [Thermoascus thermophilus]
MHLTTLLPLALLTAAATTSPISPRDDTYTITTAQLLTIAPASNTCANAPAPDQCATAAQAAPLISASFQRYGVTSRAEQAAVVGLMAFESAQFRYNRNVDPGVPGQGTRNMQSPTFNARYAAALNLNTTGKDPAAVLDLILASPENDFGSGAWFLTAVCPADVRAALQTGSEDGWTRFVTGCVGTQVTEERRAFWGRAVLALGVQQQQAVTRGMC